MGLRLWSFQTCECGRRHDDEPIDAPRVPETITCECGREVGWARQKRMAQVHRSLSTLYGRGVDPQTGVAYESYEHKKRVLKEQGREEVGIEREDDIMNDAAPEHGPRNPNVQTLDAESDEEVKKQLLDKVYQDPRVDRKHSGSPREQFLDSWLKF
jgi:hypothetical protein